MGDYINNSDSGNFQSWSPSTCLFYELASKEESYFELMAEEILLCVDQIQTFPGDLHEHTKPSLIAEDEKNE